MWGGSQAYINVSFDNASPGHLAMVIYEWTDVMYLGKPTTSETDDDLPKTYVCTSSAVAGGYCTPEQLGQFIIDLPQGKSLNETSFWSARVELTGKTESSSIRDNSPGRQRETGISQLIRRQATFANSSEIITYTEPIHYPVEKTGFYCVAVIPVTVQSPSTSRASTGTLHPSYEGSVLFRNTFNGLLPATDYPKVNFYFMMFLFYTAFGLVWAWFCYRHLQELLPIQHYLSGLVGILVIEMFASWGYYRYLNAHGKTTASTVFLIVVAILDAGRNSMSFFMLLVVSLGLSVVRESLGRTMLRCQVLAGLHFLFGILYGIGIVELTLESTSALVLLLFIVPLAFTLSGFLLWIMYSLNATIAHLRARKQRYKLRMFQRLHLVLLFAVLVVLAFFVVSSVSFSGRLAEDYVAKTWRLRWWLLDGWLALLYFVCFITIAFIWRPSANNRRLAMSDEVAQDEEDAEDYDLDAIQNRSRAREDDDDDAATLVAGRRGHHNDSVTDDQVVFEIGDEDEDEDTKKRRLSGENVEDDRGERQGLMR
jgi:hypothetical protein